MFYCHSGKGKNHNSYFETSQLSNTALCCKPPYFGKGFIVPNFSINILKQKQIAVNKSLYFEIDV